MYIFYKEIWHYNTEVDRKSPSAQWLVSKEHNSIWQIHTSDEWSSWMISFKTVSKAENLVNEQDCYLANSTRRGFTVLYCTIPQHYYAILYHTTLYTLFYIIL
jgi:hypothetical protein